MISGQRMGGVFSKDIGPIDRNIGDQFQTCFSGDQFSYPHAFIRDRQKVKNSRVRKHNEIYDVVVIGGGMAGMVAAWQLRGLKVLVLEQASRLGGNSKGESWRGTDYSIGAAYITLPERGSRIDQLLSETGCYSVLRETKEASPIIVDGQKIDSIWEHDLDVKTSSATRILKQHFEDVYNSTNGLNFPEMPYNGAMSANVVRSLDTHNFYDHLVKVLGRDLPPIIDNLIEHYCWSSFGASMREISAAAGLNFYSCEFHPLLVGAGGNSSIVDKLYSNLPNTEFRTDQLICNVSLDGKLANIRAINTELNNEMGCQERVMNDGLITEEYQSRFVVMTTPKFMAKSLLTDLEDVRLQAIDSLEYRAYLVANILIKDRVTSQIYDIYFSSNRQAVDDTITRSEKQGFTDVILANFADSDGYGTVLTLYKSYPFRGGRAILANMTEPQTVLEEFKKQIYKDILPTLGLTADIVHDIRFTRWGHALPIARCGIYRDRTPEILSKPYKNTIFFAQQDNWCLPAFETSALTAFRATDDIKSRLSR